MEILKYLIHVIGFVIIFFIVDYKREKPIVSLLKLKGWAVILLVIMAATLIKV